MYGQRPLLTDDSSTSRPQEIVLTPRLVRLEDGHVVVVEVDISGCVPGDVVRLDIEEACAQAFNERA